MTGLLQIDRKIRELISPIKCVELNLYTHSSKSEAALEKVHLNTDLFDFLVDAIRPPLLFVHGNSPILHLSKLLGTEIAKDSFTSSSYKGRRLEVYAACRHMAYVSRNYAAIIGEKLRRAIHDMDDPRPPNFL